MADDLSNLTVGERFLRDTRVFRELIDHPSGRQDTPEAQKRLWDLYQEFALVGQIIDRLHLFSDNEGIDEVTTSYLPFLNCPYYGARVASQLMVNLATGTDAGVAQKPAALATAKRLYVRFLIECLNYHLLNQDQQRRIDSFKLLYDPLAAELAGPANPMARRQQKIDNYKQARQLEAKLNILDDYYKPGDESFGNLDELVVRQVFLDQIQYHILNAFSNLELVAMELEVLGNIPDHADVSSKQQLQQQQQQPSAPEDPTGYTPRVESISHHATPGDLLSRQGKILRPFTITLDRNQLKLKVFGTGQVLPLMTVEEYLDWELKNGKMAAEDPNGMKREVDSDEYDLDEEREQRAWDDWKDANPKGAGNIKGNIG